MRSRLLRRATALAAAVLLLAPAGAYADTISVDGDITVSSNDVALTGTCDTPAAGRVEVKRTGGQNEGHYQPGTRLTVSVATGSQVRVTVPQVTVPSTYANGQSGAFTFDITTSVVSGATTGSSSVLLTVSGPDGRNGTLSISGSYNVSWNCAAANTAPAVTVTGVSNGATYEYGTVPAAACSVIDAEDGNRSFAATLSPVSGPRAAAGLGSQTASCSATDTGGLSGQASATYEVVDTSGPVFGNRPNRGAEATSAAGATVTWPAVTAADAVDGVLTAACTPDSGSTFALGTTTVTCTAADLAGNRSSITFEVLVLDTTAPALTLPESIVAEATSADGAAVSYQASATDAVSGARDVTCAPASGSTFALGTTTVSCEATDAAGNKATGRFAVSVQDETAPAVTVPEDATLEATGPGGATHAFSASATDAVDGDIVPTCDPASGSLFGLGGTTVTCSATDTAGNLGSAGFVVTVLDTTAPVLTLPADITAEASSSSGALVNFAVSASDLVDGDVPVTCDWVSGDGFALGSTTVTCTAEDKSGNDVSGSFTVTVADTTAPAMPELADLGGIEATGPDGARVSYDAGTASDVVDGSVPVTCAPASDTTFALGDTEVTCTATDAAGNTGETGFTVTVVDTTKPELTLPANTTVEATGPRTAISYSDQKATDLVDGDVAVTCAPASGSTHPLGAVTVDCSATDKAGNTAEGSFVITVQDKTAPVVEKLDNVTAEATSSAGAVVAYGTVWATDAVDGELIASCTPASGGVFPLGDTQVACTATDSSDNTGRNEFTVTVRDTTAPTVTVPGVQKLTATSAAGAPLTFAASALDAVDGDVPVTCTLPGGKVVTSGSVLPLGSSTVTCTATDNAGNKASATFQVEVTVGWGGFGQPLNPGSTHKLNSTIPVKFNLSGASAGIAGLDAKLYVRRLDGTPSGTPVADVSSNGKANDGNTFRYDADGRQYIFNLATKPLGEGRYELRVDLGDGTSRTIEVTIRK